MKAIAAKPRLARPAAAAAKRPRARVVLAPAPAGDARRAELARAIAHLLDLGAKR
jgi:hypothetical protein